MILDLTPLAYSYIRFSTPQQAEGDSLRRQTDAAKVWCEKNGVRLDESFKLHDLGESAYSHNADLKALNTFLKMVEAGTVRKGSYLIVESLDRITRQDLMAAVNQVSGICLAGIRIVQLQPQQMIYDDKASLGDFITMIVELCRANSERKVKSERVSAARDRARKMAQENKKILTRRAPAWLTIENDRFQLIPEAKETITFLFQLKLQGLGLPTIEKKMNEEASWMPPGTSKSQGTGWRESYIRKILSNPAVLGIYQPCKGVNKRGSRRIPIGDPIPDYFPRIIEDDIFHAVQSKQKSNKGKGGRNGRCYNLFSCIAKCPYCSGTMILEDRAPMGLPYRYLMCDNGRRHTTKEVNGAKIPICSRRRMRLDIVEDTILESCVKLRPEHILPNASEQAQRAELLRVRIAGREAELVSIEEQQNNLIDQIATTKSPVIRDRYEAKVAELDGKKSALKLEMEADAKALQEASIGNDTFADWQKQMVALREVLASGPVEVRMKTREHLRQVIERVDVFADGYPAEEAEHFAEYLEESLREDNPEFKPDRNFKSFSIWITQQMQTKRARFLRVLFKGAAQPVDLVPPRSIAMGRRLHPNGLESIVPDTAALWKEWQKEASK